MMERGHPTGTPSTRRPVVAIAVAIRMRASPPTTLNTTASWRATTLDTFVDNAWREELLPTEAVRPRDGSRDLLTDDPLLPKVGHDATKWTEATVHIDALRDRHVISPSGPVAFAGDALHDIQYYRGAVAEVPQPLTRGTEYNSWAFEPRPTPSLLARSPARYPSEIYPHGPYLEVGPGKLVPPFGTQKRLTWLSHAFDDARLSPYRSIYRAAEDVAGTAPANPYAATVAIEAWLRSSGGFTYDETPPRVQGAPLVQFVTRTKRGYCQHFAGAMALMLRYLGIPARVAAGFTSGAYDKEAGTWSVNDREAHTWVEVWFKGYGWLPFDPTPGRGTLGGPYTTSSVSFDAGGAARVLAASALAGRSLLRFELGPLGKEARARSAGGGGAAGDRAGAGGSDRQGGVGVALIVVLVALIGAFFLVVGKLVVRRSRFLTKDPRELAAACRREVVDFLKDQRIDVPRSIGPHELGGLLSKRVGVEAGGFAAAVGLARFGPASTAPSAALDARRELHTVRKRLRRAIPTGRRVRGLFSLRSLLK